MIRLYHPQYGFTGTVPLDVVPTNPVAGTVTSLSFSNGVASVASLSDQQTAQLKLRGYTIIDDALASPGDIPVFLADLQDNTSDAGTTLSTVYGPYATTKRAAIVLGSDLSAPTTSFSDVLQRTIVRYPTPTTRWRLRVRNLGLTGPITGAASVNDVYIGKPNIGTGSWDGSMVGGTPAKALTAFSLPADGSEVVTPWVTDPTLQFAQFTNTVVSIGWTCTPGQSISYGSASCVHLRYGTGSAAQVGAAAPTGGTTGPVGGFFDVHMEVEFVGLNRVVMVVSDSTGYGVTDDTSLRSLVHTIEQAWPNRAAYINRAFCTNASVSGRTAFDFRNLTDPMWTRFDLVGAPPDDAIVALGINDAFQAVSLASYQSFMTTLVANLRTFNVQRVFATTVMPLPSMKPGALTVAAASGVTSLKTDYAFANADVVDIDYGLSTYEQRTVTGASVAVGDGSYTTTVTVATGQAHRVGASITGTAETLRRQYNAWLRTMPLGLDGLFDIEPLLRAPAGPTHGTPDPVLWGTGATHPGRGAYERVASRVDLRFRP